MKKTIEGKCKHCEKIRPKFNPTDKPWALVAEIKKGDIILVCYECLCIYYAIEKKVNIQ